MLHIIWSWGEGAGYSWEEEVLAVTFPRFLTF